MFTLKRCNPGSERCVIFFHCRDPLLKLSDGRILRHVVLGQCLELEGWRAVRKKACFAAQLKFPDEEPDDEHQVTGSIDEEEC